MRTLVPHMIAASLLIVAPAAQAGSPSFSATQNNDTAESSSSGGWSMATDLLWRSLDVKIGLNASEETEDAASQETCDKADKTAAKKTQRKSIAATMKKKTPCIRGQSQYTSVSDCLQRIPNKAN